MGRYALHIFDKTHRSWICSCKELGYESLAEGLLNEDSDASASDDDLPDLIMGDDLNGDEDWENIEDPI